MNEHGDEPFARIDNLGAISVGLNVNVLYFGISFS